MSYLCSVKQKLNLKYLKDMTTTAFAINNATAYRAIVIASRTQSVETGIAKALLIDNLKMKLANGIAHFIFRKKNGELREAWGTTQRNIASAKVNGRGADRETYNTTAYFDVEKGAWRSFRWETLVQVF